MPVSLTRVSAARVQCTITDATGNTTFTQRIDPYSASGQNRLLAATRLSQQRLMDELNKLGGAIGDKHSFELPDQQKPLSFLAILRGQLQTREEAREFEGPTAENVLMQVMECTDFPSANPLIEWADTDALACLDIDYHTLPYEQRPTYDQLANLVSCVAPQPILWHTSHGRGAKLYYLALESFKASELAACAAIAWTGRDARATAEIKKNTRHPRYMRTSDNTTCSTPVRLTADTDLPALAQWLSRGSDPDAIHDHIMTHGYKVGARLPHTSCLIEPSRPSKGEPVFVGEKGLFCHSCEAHGKTYAPRIRPGFMPWSAQLGGVDSRVYTMAKRRTHWEHARFILRHLTGLPDEILRSAYSACMKVLAKEPTDPRIKNAFRTRDLVRLPGRWVFNNGTTTLARDSRYMLAELPAVQTAKLMSSGEWNLGVDQTDLEEFRHGGNDLSRFGYYDLQPVRGVAVWGQHLPYPDGRVPFRTPDNDLPDDRQPRYRREGERLSEVDAKKTLETIFPKLNFQYVEALIAARGCIEGGHPSIFMMISGVSGSAKTTTSNVAAAILGDRVTAVDWTKDTARYRQAFMQGIDNGSFVRVDEIFKSAERERMSARQALDPILNLTADSVSHKLYVGPTKLGTSFVGLFTDIATPADIASDIQLARRLWYLRLTGRVPDWMTTTGAAGLTDIGKLRALSVDMNLACDSLLSVYIDRWFRCANTWSDIAAKLGIQKLESSDDFEDSAKVLIKFFDLVCSAPELTGSDKARYPGEGWKLIKRGEENASPLSECWSELCNDTGEKWCESRRLLEPDWSKLLNVDFPEGVTCDIRPYKKTSVYVRFRVGDARKPIAVNRSILPVP